MSRRVSSPLFVADSSTSNNIFSLSNDITAMDPAVQQEINKLIGSSSVKESNNAVVSSRGETRERVEGFVEYVKAVLKTYDVPVEDS